MGKSATTVEEQIKLLRKRGMDLDLPDEKVQEILLDIGYYRMGFYWNPFEEDKEHQFRKGTKFSSAVQLYYLDFDLRNLLMKYLNRIEVHFRTQIIYTVSNHYKDSPTWFADPAVMDSWFLNELSKYYSNNFIKLNGAIKSHHSKYINDKYAPAWKTLEFLPFGSILAIYRALKSDEIKSSISQEYGIRRIQIFKEYLKTLLTLRNICAHGGQLFDFQTPKGIPGFPGLQLAREERHSLFGVFKLILYFLSQISENRRNELNIKVNELLRTASTNETIKEIIETKMGFKDVTS